jgi:hypothetical protein
VGASEGDGLALEFSAEFGGMWQSSRCHYKDDGGLMLLYVAGVTSIEVDRPARQRDRMRAFYTRKKRLLDNIQCLRKSNKSFTTKELC